MLVSKPTANNKYSLVPRFFKMAEKKSLDSTNMQNKMWSLKSVSVIKRPRSAPGLQQDQDIQGAVQNRDCWIKTSHIDYTTYFQLSEVEKL